MPLETALACGETVLLETSPGHATRCADTPYVRMFTSEKHRLQSEGLAQQEVWAELEQLNLGRLRLASKGLRRDADRVVSVDEDEQRAEGMVMIGQVAALRSKTTTIDALHEQVTSGASAFVEAAARVVNADKVTGWPLFTRTASSGSNPMRAYRALGSAIRITRVPGATTSPG